MAVTVTVLLYRWYCDFGRLVRAPKLMLKPINTPYRDRTCEGGEGKKCGEKPGVLLEAVLVRGIVVNEPPTAPCRATSKDH